MKQIITIGRQFGSGGHEIGTRLAEALDVPYYDKDLLKRAAKESGLCEHLFENFDERPRSLLFSLAMDPYAFSNPAAPFGSVEQEIFLATFNAVKQVAAEGPCVIIGRCADYALREREDVLNLFIHAPLAERVKRIARVRGLSEAKAKDQINKMDKQRASYYNYYTSKKWGAVSSYDYCLDSSILGIDGTVELVRYILDKMG
ncbi:MAG: cytidylate kinase-like family protein [Clostridia bacterium]|nr:cytidylate kinase-like family protein [Clostridia bacterium]